MNKYGWYSLQLPHRGNINEYLQHHFSLKNSTINAKKILLHLLYIQHHLNYSSAGCPWLHVEKLSAL